MRTKFSAESEKTL